MRYALLILILFFCLPAVVTAQENGGLLEGGQVTGSFQMDGQYYFEDTLIGTPAVDEKIRVNAYGQIQYTLKGFTAGIRYEAYLPKPILGLDERYAGSGIANRYLRYDGDRISITVGHFYEQFGMGMSLRAWWDPLLGYDTAIDGVRVVVRATKGVNVKMLAGHQRFYWGESRGTVRGADLDVDLAELLGDKWKSTTQVRFGGSAVSKFEPGKTLLIGAYNYKTPENVAAFAGRMSVQRGRFQIQGEYAYKTNDPASVNQFIYRPGQALYIAASYTKKNFGVNVEAKRVDNMDFRGDRTQKGIGDQLINFVPPIARLHTYRLPTLYVYATQPRGEMGAQADVFFKIKPGSPWGGTYGTMVSLNASFIQNIDTTARVDERGYDAKFFSLGSEQYYRDFNIEIQRKFSSKVKATVQYINMLYNRGVILSNARGGGSVGMNAATVDVTYSFNKKHSLRTEAQIMLVKEIDQSSDHDFKDWGMLMLEYNFSPYFFFVVSDEYNYGNIDPAKRLHYYMVMTGTVFGATRIAVSYARIRSGLNCAGGICRQVPAMNGFFMTVSSTF